MVRVGRLTALAKLDGGVRGIVAGDVVRSVQNHCSIVERSSGDSNSTSSICSVASPTCCSH